MEPVHSLLEGLDVKDDYDDIIKDGSKRKKHARNEKDKGSQEMKENKDHINDSKQRQKRKAPNNKSQDHDISQDSNLDDIMAEKSSLDLIKNWDGYYIGDVWSAQRNKNLRRLIDRERGGHQTNSYAQRPFYQNVDNHGYRIQFRIGND